jgi:hypothetical protein
VTGYGVDGRDSIPGRGKIFLFSTASRQALEPSRPPIQRVPEMISPEAKQPRRKADRSPPSSAEVKNSGAMPALANMSSWHSAY